MILKAELQGSKYDYIDYYKDFIDKLVQRVREQEAKGYKFIDAKVVDGEMNLVFKKIKEEVIII